MTDGLRHDYTPIGLGKNWVTSVGGLPPMVRDVAHALIRSGRSESEAIQLAVGVIKRWAAGNSNHWHGAKHVTPQTQAKAAAAIAQWEAMKAAAHAKSAAKDSDGKRSSVVAIEALLSGYRDSGFGGAAVTEGSSSGDLIPRGIPAAQAKAVVNKLGDDADVPHAFRGRGEKCSVCGMGMTAKLHLLGPKRAQAIPPVPREAGTRAEPTVIPPAITVPAPTRGLSVHRRRALKAAFVADCDTIEPKFHAAVSELFEKQRQATISRLKGRRGRQMLRTAGVRADSTAGPAGGAAEIPPAVNAPDADAIFDSGFWVSATAAALASVYDDAAKLGVAQVRNHLGESLTTAEAAAGEPQIEPTLPTEAAGVAPVPTTAAEAAGASVTELNPPAAPPSTEGPFPRASLDNVVGILQARAKRMGEDVTQTTHQQIQDTLAKGVDNGEAMPQLVDRLQHVFDVAQSRAANIARTETVGALNESAHSYASSLPKSVAGRKMWAAHHDDRTRPSHRVADTQTVDIDKPFMVGPPTDPPFPLMFPGDPVAPPNLTCGCRCTLFYLPAERALSLAA